MNGQPFPGIVFDEQHAYQWPIVQRAVADMPPDNKVTLLTGCQEAEIAMLEERLASLRGESS